MAIEPKSPRAGSAWKGHLLDKILDLGSTHGRGRPVETQSHVGSHGVAPTHYPVGNMMGLLILPSVTVQTWPERLQVEYEVTSKARSFRF